jgi:hypothetical protein
MEHTMVKMYRVFTENVFVCPNEYCFWHAYVATVRAGVMMAP